MTRKHRETALFMALLVSVLVHCSLMIYMRQVVMSHGLRSEFRHVRHDRMRITAAREAQNLVDINDVADVSALREAPKAESREVIPPPVDSSTLTGNAQSIREFSNPIAETPIGLNEPPPQFKVEVLAFDKSPAPKLELPRPSVAPPVSAKPSAVIGALPGASAAAPKASPDFARLPLPDNGVMAVVDSVKKSKSSTFVPATEVYQEVDSRIVAEEKQAVRQLLNVPDANNLAEYVEIGLSAANDNKWMYFRLSVTPKASLPVISKDVVLIFDASGSIGKDRMGSIRGAGKRLLRVLANTDDRFNLVAFRDRYSYAFRAWQECTRQSFDQADAWFNRTTPYGRTDVFSTMASVLTLPRDPKRPLVALVVTDGDANSGVYRNSEILTRFTELNDGLVSLYMYGVKSSANRELIDALTHANRGEGHIFDGWRWNAGSELEQIAVRFRDPVLSDLRLVFATGCDAEVLPHRLRNLYRSETLEIVGRAPRSTSVLAFSLKGLNGAKAYEGFIRLEFASARHDSGLVGAWANEVSLEQKLHGQ